MDGNGTAVDGDMNLLLGRRLREEAVAIDDRNDLTRLDGIVKIILDVLPDPMVRGHGRLGKLAQLFLSESRCPDLVRDLVDVDHARTVSEESHAVLDCHRLGGCDGVILRVVDIEPQVVGRRCDEPAKLGASQTPFLHVDRLAVDVDSGFFNGCHDRLLTAVWQAGCLLNS